MVDGDTVYEDHCARLSWAFVAVDANGVVVRAAQAALVACKGAGFVHGHLAEQVVRESMFFLVWSCPQAVAHAVMCDLVGNIE